MIPEIKENLNKILETIAQAKEKSPYSQDVALLAVSKKQPIEKVLEYLEVAREQNVPILLGENYVQEWASKKSELGGDTSSHLIGPLQRNKAAQAITLFDLIQSVHSLPLLKEIDKQAKKSEQVQNIFLQINISEDPNKSGFLATELKSLFEQEAPQLKNISIKGLMTITKFYENKEDVRPDFKKMKKLQESIVSQYDLCGVALSMGMSADYDIAIEEGATLVRVGSALFGKRI